MKDRARGHVCVLAFKSCCPVFNTGHKHHVAGLANMPTFCLLKSGSSAFERTHIDGNATVYVHPSDNLNCVETDTRLARWTKRNGYHALNMSWAHVLFWFGVLKKGGCEKDPKEMDSWGDILSPNTASPC